MYWLPGRSGRDDPGTVRSGRRLLLLGGIDRLIDYHADDVQQPTHLDILVQLGFQVLTINERGWELALGR